MSDLLAVAWDEARTVARDVGALLVLVGAILVYAVFYPQPYLPEVLRDVPVVVLDRDDTPASRALARTVDAHELVAVARRTTDPAIARAMVLAGEAGGVLEIPADFARTIARGEPATVGLFADASTFLVYRQALTGLAESVRVFSARIELRRFAAGGSGASEARARRDPIPLVVRSLYNPVEGYASYIVPAVLVLILQQTLLIGVGMLAGTRAEDTATRPPRRAAAGPATTVLGRALAYLALYALHATLYFGLARRLFDFPERGAAGDVAALALPFLLAAIFLALAAGRLFRRRESAMQLLLFTSLPAIFLAGFAWPSEAVPPTIRALFLLLPSSSAIPALLRVEQMGADLAAVRPELSTLWALVALYFVLAWLGERRTRART